MLQSYQRIVPPILIHLFPLSFASVTSRCVSLANRYDFRIPPLSFPSCLCRLLSFSLFLFLLLFFISLVHPELWSEVWTFWKSQGRKRRRPKRSWSRSSKGAGEKRNKLKSAHKRNVSKITRGKEREIVYSYISLSVCLSKGGEIDTSLLSLDSQRRLKQ